MHPSSERVQQALRDAGCPAEIRTMTEPTPTAAAAAAVLGTTTAQIANSLVFVADGAPVLVLTSGANRVDLGKVAALLGATTVRRADPDTVRAATGYVIGGVPPLGHATDLPVLLDEDLLAHAEVWAAGGTHDTLFATAPKELLRVTGARAADVRQDTPR